MAEKKIETVMGVRDELQDEAVIVKNLRVAFGAKEILRDVSFTVRRGEILVLMGLSGTGKSTTLRSIAGLLKPNSGEVLVNGKSIPHMTDRELELLRRRIGFCFQHGALFDSMTVGENVAFGLREHTKLPEEELQRIVAEKLSSSIWKGWSISIHPSSPVVCKSAPRLPGPLRPTRISFCTTNRRPVWTLSSVGLSMNLSWTFSVD